MLKVESKALLERNEDLENALHVMETNLKNLSKANVELTVTIEDLRDKDVDSLEEIEHLNRQNKRIASDNVILMREVERYKYNK